MICTYFSVPHSGKINCRYIGIFHSVKRHSLMCQRRKSDFSIGFDDFLFHALNRPLRSHPTENNFSRLTFSSAIGGAFLSNAHCSLFQFRQLRGFNRMVNKISVFLTSARFSALRLAPLLQTFQTLLVSISLYFKPSRIKIIRYLFLRCSPD